jgi:6-phosphofructokinase 1
MGRHSGYIASYAALALSEVNFVLIPELPFDLKGENGFLNLLKKRLESRHHAVIVVAEGAGQEYFQENNSTDPSGNKRLNDIGMFLKDEIGKFMREQNISHSIKYIDPSYIIRSVPAVPNDAIFSSQLARYAVHAGMAGKTSVLVGWRKNVFVHIPIEKIINKRKTVNTETQFWLSVLEATGQPMRMVNEPRQF